MIITDEMVERAKADETEGRHLYRLTADSVARAQFAIARRRVTYNAALEAALSGKEEKCD